MSFIYIIVIWIPFGNFLLTVNAVIRVWGWLLHAAVYVSKGFQWSECHQCTMPFKKSRIKNFSEAIRFSKRRHAITHDLRYFFIFPFHYPSGMLNTSQTFLLKQQTFLWDNTRWIFRGLTFSHWHVDNSFVASKPTTIVKRKDFMKNC